MNLKLFLFGSVNTWKAKSTQLLMVSTSIQNTKIHPCVIVFGRPGAGKSTVADAAVAKLECTETDIRCLGLDLDVCVPTWMRDNFAKGIYPTLKERETFAMDCCDYVEAQVKKHCDDSIIAEMATIVSFSFVNTDLRDVFRSRFPDAKWVLIDTKENEATRRINMREGHFYKGKMGDGMEKAVEKVESDAGSTYEENSDWNFAPVTFDHVLLDGTRSVEENANRVVQVLREVITLSS